MKLKIYKTIFAVLIISLIIVIAFIVIKYHNSQLNEAKNKEVVETFATSLIQNDNEENANKPQNITLEGYNVIGIIRIPKINLEYPILDIDTYNPDETKEPMKIAIVKYWGGQVNEYGNLSIAGHNNYDGTMFGKTKNLNISDIIEMTDLSGTTIQYEIYDKFITDPNDITILQTKDKTIRELTIITCTNGNKNRLVLKAKEIFN